MKVKIFSAISASSLEKKVNDFLATNKITLLQMQYSHTAKPNEYSVILAYKEPTIE